MMRVTANRQRLARRGVALPRHARSRYARCPAHQGGLADDARSRSGAAAAEPSSVDRRRRGVMPVEVLADDPQVAGVRAEEEIRQRADQRDQPEQPVDPDIAAIRAICIFDMPRLRASHTIQPPIAAAIDVADDRHEVEDEVEPDRRLMPGTTNIRSSSSPSPRSAARTAAGSRPSGRRDRGGVSGVGLGHGPHLGSVRSRFNGCQARAFGSTARSRSATSDQRSGRAIGMKATSAASAAVGLRRIGRARSPVSGAVAARRDQLGDRPSAARLAGGRADTSARCHRARPQSTSRRSALHRRAPTRIGVDADRAQRGGDLAIEIVAPGPAGSAMRRRRRCRCHAATRRAGGGRRRRSAGGTAPSRAARAARAESSAFGQDRVGRRPAVGKSPRSARRGRSPARSRRDCRVGQEAVAVDDRQPEQPGAPDRSGYWRARHRPARPAASRRSCRPSTRSDRCAAKRSDRARRRARRIKPHIVLGLGSRRCPRRRRRRDRPRGAAARCAPSPATTRNGPLPPRRLLGRQRQFGLGEQLQQVGARAVQPHLDHLRRHRDDLVDRGQKGRERVARSARDLRASARRRLCGGHRRCRRPSAPRAGGRCSCGRRRSRSSARPAPVRSRPAASNRTSPCAVASAQQRGSAARASAQRRVGRPAAARRSTLTTTGHVVPGAWIARRPASASGSSTADQMVRTAGLEPARPTGEGF